MTDPSPSPGSGGPDRGSQPGMPRWVKAFAVVGGVVVVLLVILLLAGGGHGPGRHSGGGDTPSSGTVEHMPEGGHGTG